MEKKPNVKVPLIVLLRLIVFLIIGLGCFISYSRAQDALLHNSFFRIHDVMVERSINFIDLKTVQALKGKNIFTVDIAKLHRRLKGTYPQISQLHIVRELPDKIWVLAKRRDAVMAWQQKSRYLLVDHEGVALYYADGPGPLPVVIAPSARTGKFQLGGLLRADWVDDALSIIKAFRLHPMTARFKITSVDLNNQSRYVIACAGGFQVLLDKDNYGAKLDMLEALLARQKIDFNSAKYIDLRFNEPVLGENPP